MEKFVDIEKILKIAQKAGPIPSFKRSIFVGKPLPAKVTIALALDEAFHFYYQNNLDILKHYGAKLVTFSPLSDKKLPPETNGIYIGGGFPELFAKELSGNYPLKKDIHRKAVEGMPVYAECGGLMYLVEKISDFKGEKFPMVGILPGKIKMEKKLRALGYCKIKLLKSTILGRKGESVKGHIFHWSYLTLSPEKVTLAYEVEKSGQKFYDGLSKNNVLASYVHIHFGSKVSWARNFVNRCAKYSSFRKEQRNE
jgi:cobyrinic acid a,c-diamide synthase